MHCDTFVSMRLIFSICLLFALSYSAQSQTASPLQFEASEIELGSVKKGDRVAASFQYTNTSKESVYIDLVSTCVCTKAEWSEDEILAGESGEISFIFDSTKKDDEEPVDVDVILRNTDADGNPFFHYLSYTFEFEK